MQRFEELGHLRMVQPSDVLDRPKLGAQSLTGVTIARTPATRRVHSTVVE
jgi:hypothetical protein